MTDHSLDWHGSLVQEEEAVGSSGDPGLPWRYAVVEVGGQEAVGVAFDEGGGDVSSCGGQRREAVRGGHADFLTGPGPYGSLDESGPAPPAQKRLPKI